MEDGWWKFLVEFIVQLAAPILAIIGGCVVLMCVVGALVFANALIEAAKGVGRRLRWFWTSTEEW